VKKAVAACLTVRAGVVLTRGPATRGCRRSGRRARRRGGRRPSWHRECRRSTPR